jgi:hypothetical protein
MNLIEAKRLLNNPNFLKWFGKSKVIDEVGNPLRVFHGTPNKFNSFTEGYGKEFTKRGIHFTDNKQVSDAFGGDENTIEAYLSMQNPLVVDAKGNHWLKIPFEDGTTNSDLLANIARERGHDGVIIRNVKDPNPLMGNSYIALDPTQIKSVNNRGTFDPKDPNILKGAAMAVGAASLYSPENAQAREYQNKIEEDALEEAYNPLDMAVAAVTGGGTLTFRAAQAALDPIIDTVSRKIFGE